MTASRAGASRACRSGRALLEIALATSPALGCAERERPEPISDPSGPDARRVLAGSFAAPSADAGAGAASSGGLGGAANVGGAGPNAGAGAGGDSVFGSQGATSDEPITLRQTYEAVCDEGTVQWGFFTYAAATPGDSSIAFRLRTAATENELAAAFYVDLVVASGELGTDRCTFTGPAPCPIDLFVVLDGAPRAHHPLSELEAVLYPASSDGRVPSVDEFNLNYSCTFNQ